MEINKEIVHENPWFKVTKEDFIRHDDKPCTFYVVNKNKAVFILPIKEQDGQLYIYLVKQYRHATRTCGWELPAGAIDDGEKPIVAAMRELQEETGLTALQWRQVGTIHLAPGLSNNKTYIYEAKRLTMTPENTQEEEGIIDCRSFPINTIKIMIKDGRIHDAPTIACLAKVFWIEK